MTARPAVGRNKLYCILTAVHFKKKYIKMKYFRSLLVVASVIAIGMMSCSKGSTGPAGATGPAGPDSVFSSAWIPLNFTYNSDDSLYEDTLTASTITAGILDSGLVLSYIQFIDQNNVLHIQAISALSNIISEDYSAGKINIICIYDLTSALYRYVTIPGSLKTGNSANTKIKGYTPTELKAMSYEQVQAVLAQKN
jgi:hypothetical protein